MAEPPPDRSARDAPPDRAGADGRDRHRRPRRRGLRRRWPRIAELRDPRPGGGGRRDPCPSSADHRPVQRQLLLPRRRNGRSWPGTRLAGPAGRLSTGVRRGLRRAAGPARHPPVRRGALCRHRGHQADGGEFPFRPARAAPAGARQGRRMHRHVIGHHGRGGRLAGGARRRRRHRAGDRGRRPPRQLHRVGRPRPAAGNPGAGAAGGRCRPHAGDRRGWDRRRSWHRGGPGAGRQRRATRHGLSAVPGGPRRRRCIAPRSRAPMPE